MNERIEQLADQCMTERQDSNGVYVEFFDHKKFAGLIVGECASFIKEVADMQLNLDHKVLLKMSSIALLQKFGDE